MKITGESFMLETRGLSIRVDEVDDITLRYGVNVINPEMVVIKWRRVFMGNNSEGWKLAHVSISGPQRLKSGGLSATAVFNSEFPGWDKEELPKWVLDLIADTEPTG